MWQRRAAGLALLFSATLFSCAPEPYHAAAPPKSGKIELIVRVDEIGTLHAANEVAQRLAQNSIATDFSVIVNSGWFWEAAETWRAAPEASLGIQLTLTSPWKRFKWGPVSQEPATALLRDPFGNFPENLAAPQNYGSDSLAVITEFRAQIHRARAAGLQPVYLHFPGAANGPAFLRAILEALAYEYHLGVTGYFDARPAPLPAFERPEQAEKAVLEMLNRLTPGRWVFAVAAADTTAEYRAAGFPDRRELERRAALTQALQSNVVAALCVERGIERVSYRTLLQRAGLLQVPVTEKR